MRASVLAALLFAVPAAAGAQEVNLYTTREPGLIQPLLDAFTKSSGIKVNTVFVKDGLLERVKAEGARSPADVLMTVDIGNLLDLVEATHGVLDEVGSAGSAGFAGFVVTPESCRLDLYWVGAPPPAVTALVRGDGRVVVHDDADHDLAVRAIDRRRHHQRGDRARGGRAAGRGRPRGATDRRVGDRGEADRGRRRPGRP